MVVVRGDEGVMQAIQSVKCLSGGKNKNKLTTQLHKDFDYVAERSRTVYIIVIVDHTYFKIFFQDGRKQNLPDYFQ